MSFFYLTDVLNLSLSLLYDILTIMEYVLFGLAVGVLIALLLGITWYNKQKKASPKKERNLIPVCCPVCDSELYKGENLVSKVYRPMKVSDQLMTVNGCPHCYPKCPPALKRMCPVCHKELRIDEALTARLFNKTVGKKHVHILGCSHCHKPRSD